MFDKGAWIACAFPKWKHLIKWHFIIRFHKKSALPLGAVVRQINAGIKAYRDLQGFPGAAQGLPENDKIDDSVRLRTER